MPASAGILGRAEARGPLLGLLGQFSVCESSGGLDRLPGVRFCLLVRCVIDFEAAVFQIDGCPAVFGGSEGIEWWAFEDRHESLL